MRKRYRDRRIQRDTLVWHPGLREWQPLAGMAEELELDSVQPDASLPPPLPPPLLRLRPIRPRELPPALTAAAPAATPAATRPVRLRDRRHRAGRSGHSGDRHPRRHRGARLPGLHRARARSTAGLVGAASAMKRPGGHARRPHRQLPGQRRHGARRSQRFTRLHPKSRLSRSAASTAASCAFEFTLARHVGPPPTAAPAVRGLPGRRRMRMGLQRRHPARPLPPGLVPRRNEPCLSSKPRDESAHDPVVLQRLRAQPPRPGRRRRSGRPARGRPACSPTPWSGARA